MDEIETPDAVFEYEQSYGAVAVVASYWSPNPALISPAVLVAVRSRHDDLLYAHVFNVLFVRAEDGSAAVELRADPDLRIDWIERVTTGEHAAGAHESAQAAFYGMWSRGLLDQPAFAGSGRLPEVLHPTLEGWKFLTGAACPAVAVSEWIAV